MIEHKLYNFELIVFSRTNEGGSRSNVVVLMVQTARVGSVGLRQYDITPDGKRLVVVLDAAPRNGLSRSQINFVFELARRT